MASTYEGQKLTEVHRRTQAKIAADLVAELRLTWPFLDPKRLDQTAPFWMERALDIMQTKHQLSAQVSIDYLNEFRIAEMGRTVAALQEITIPLSPAAPTSLIVNGPVKIKQGMSSGLTLNQAARGAFNELAGTAIMQVLDGGRDTVAAGVRRDRRALGMQRVTDGSPCYFCAMLASRGPVYSKDSFQRQAVHRKCGCTSEVVYNRDTNWSGKGLQWNALWEESTAGKSGQDAIRSFRQSYNLAEGKTLTSRSSTASDSVARAAKPKPEPDKALVSQAKTLNARAQDAFKRGDDAERIRLQAEASALFRQAYAPIA